MGKLNELKYDLLQHPHYLLDLAPADFHLFLQLKIFIDGKRFLRSQFHDGIMGLEHRWMKYIKLNPLTILQSKLLLVLTSRLFVCFNHVHIVCGRI